MLRTQACLRQQFHYQSGRQSVRLKMCPTLEQETRDAQLYSIKFDSSAVGELTRIEGTELKNHLCSLKDSRVPTFEGSVTRLTCRRRLVAQQDGAFCILKVYVDAAVL